MRLLLACAVLLASPAWAGCRLSTADCTIIAREIANEEILSIQDERTFHPANLTDYQRGRELIIRHFDRKAARYPHLPTRIANEWARMDLCDSIENANAQSPGTVPEKPECR